jgi:hypothetical protein
VSPESRINTDMKELIKSTNEFQAIDENNNVIALLKLIRASTVVDQRSQHPALCSLQALTKFTSFRQMNLRNNVYLEGFRDRVNLYEEITGDMIGCDSKSIEAEFGRSTINVSPNDPGLVAARRKCRDKFLAIAFIEHADKKRYADLQISLSNVYLRKKADDYPQTLVQILNKWKASESRGCTSGYSPMFMQQSDSYDGRGDVSGRGRGRGRDDGRGRPGDQPGNVSGESINPYVCIPSEGTVRTSDPVESSVEKSGASDVLMNMQQSGSTIPRHWIILDSASSPDIFYEEDLVTDIRNSDVILKVLSRGGVNEINQECTLPNYPGHVWFDPNGVANIIGLRNLIRHYNVTYDSSGDNCFHVSQDDNLVMTFRPWEGGLWYYDTGRETPLSFLTAVEDNKRKHTPRGVKQAEAARRLQDIVMRPPSKKLRSILDKRFIRNCPVESRHIQFADDIY